MAAMDDDAQQLLDDAPAGASSQRMKQEAHPDAVATNGKGPSVQPDPRPPAKRSRKAINCEPCRASKLKCDRYCALSRPRCR